MFSQSKSKEKAIRVSKIVNHHLSNVKKGFKPSPKIKNLKSVSNSTSPSPQKQEHHTPSKHKLRRTASKLFEGAHEAVEGETYLSPSHLASTEAYNPTKLIRTKLTKDNDKKTSKPLKMSIQNQYKITVGGEPTISEIMRDFQSGSLCKHQLPRIAQNSQDVLQIHSRMHSSCSSLGDLLDRI